MNRTRKANTPHRGAQRAKRRALAAIHKATIYALGQWGLTFPDLIAFDAFKRR